MYSNRYRRHLVDRINALSETEHEEIFKIMRYNNVDFTQNNNGVFFNISTVPESVIEQISNFVTFCSENKKKLDEYDKRINECKINNNYDEILQERTQDEDIIEPLEGLNEDSEKPDDWNKVISHSKNKEHLVGFLDELFDSCNKGNKRKCSSKYNIAKKKYARKHITDKKFEIEDSILIEETYLLN